MNPMAIRLTPMFTVMKYLLMKTESPAMAATPEILLYQKTVLLFLVTASTS